MLDLDGLDFARGNGLVTVVAQDATTGAVLMVAHADRTALERTLATGEMHYHSRTRGLWHKGATSGNTQHVRSLTPDCDGDAVLARVVPAGPACHAGTATCFGAAGTGGAVSELDATIAARSGTVAGIPPAQGSQSYTARLLGDRNLRLKKLGEEAAELVVACGDGDAPRAAEEGADLLYHMLVALRAAGVTWSDVQAELARRAQRQRAAAAASATE
jgi:phosphoribosyl-ATP pyrophosphohydrolase/phosphoribosyl-AMP cyclohydrolase